MAHIKAFEPFLVLGFVTRQNLELRNSFLDLLLFSN
jgi:hypothetical protein